MVHSSCAALEDEGTVVRPVAGVLDSACPGHESIRRILYLARARFAEELLHGLDEVDAAAGEPGLARGDLTPACIYRQVANMAYYMVPRYIEWRTALPHTLNHKVEKYRLREELVKNPDRAWDRERARIVFRRGA